MDKIAQEEREQTALGALYMNAAQIPDSPAEPATTIPEEDVDTDVKMMTVGPECDMVFWSGISLSPQVSVADLVNQLAAAGGSDYPMDGVMAAASSGLPMGFDTNILSSIPPEQMRQLMQQAQALLNPGQVSGSNGSAQPLPGLSPFGGGGASQAPGWNALGQFQQEFGAEFAAGDEADARARWAAAADKGRGRGLRGRGGRGRGEDGSYRSSKRRPCSFFAEGRRASHHLFECETWKKADDFSPPSPPHPDADMAINVTLATNRFSNVLDEPSLVPAFGFPSYWHAVLFIIMIIYRSLGRVIIDSKYRHSYCAPWSVTCDGSFPCQPTAKIGI